MTGQGLPDCWQLLLLANTALVWGVWSGTGAKGSRAWLGLGALGWLLIAAGVALHCSVVWLVLTLFMPPLVAAVFARAIRR